MRWRGGHITPQRWVATPLIVCIVMLRQIETKIPSLEWARLFHVDSRATRPRWGFRGRINPFCARVWTHTRALTVPEAINHFFSGIVKTERGEKRIKLVSNLWAFVWDGALNVFFFVVQSLTIRCQGVQVLFVIFCKFIQIFYCFITIQLSPSLPSYAFIHWA